MALTTAQKTTLKNDIAADPVLSLLPNSGDGPYTIAAAYNLPATPAYVVYRTNVGIRETGEAFNGADWAGMTSGNHTRLQTVAQWLTGGYNAAKADIRAMFNDIWSGAGGTTTRANLAALWIRSATRVEKLFATGAGTTVSPSVMGFEGPLTWQDVTDARNS
jgi:hypothetical protein